MTTTSNFEVALNEQYTHMANWSGELNEVNTRIRAAAQYTNGCKKLTSRKVMELDALIELVRLITERIETNMDEEINKVVEMLNS